MSFIYKFLFFILAFAAPISAQELNSRADLPHIRIELLVDHESLLLHETPPEEATRIGVLFTIEEGWHIYWKDPGEAGIPTQVQWNLPEGWEASELQWPMPTRYIEKGNIKTNSYSEEVLLFSRLTPPKIELLQDQIETISANITWLVCNDRCIPGKVTLGREITLSSNGADELSNSYQVFNAYTALVPESDEVAYRNLESTKPHTAQALPSHDLDGAQISLGLALLLAFLGGIILNFMPCVLPIIGIKVLGIVSACEKSKTQNLKDACYFSLGILLVLGALGGISVVLKESGHYLGWGFQFQDPHFLLGLIVLLFLLSLSFFDLYSATLPGVQKLSSHFDSHHSAIKHCFDGALVALLSTPCTAPFLGTALVFGFSQSTATLFMIFLAIGIGLALPYVILVSSPKLLEYFPKPGEWMNTLKQLLGIFLLLTIVWLLFVLSTTHPESTVRIILLLLAMYFGIWIYRAGSCSFGSIGKTILLLVSLSAPVASWYFAHPLHSAEDEAKNAAIQWMKYNPSLVESLPNPIFIDFTAEWCITCKYNEHFVLSKPSVAEAFLNHNVSMLKADWTSGDPMITQALEAYGGQGVPYYVLIDQEKHAYPLSNILSENSILEVLQKLNTRDDDTSS